ncbi:MAG TPA: regulatory protein RecX [Gemmatimonadales bacterium]
MIIEGLLHDPRRPGSTRVIVDGRPVWTVPAEVVDTLKLEAGKPIPSGAIDHLNAAADEEGAFRAALRALERRSHGRGELAAKLERKGHAPGAITPALERLEALGLLDDLAHARAYIASRSERGRGPVRLRYDLARLGVARSVIDQAIAELDTGEEDPLARPRELLARRVRSLGDLPVDARRRRLLAFLGRRGYRGAEANSLVDEALGKGRSR